MASLYTRLTPSSLLLLLLFYSPSHDGIWWKRGKKLFAMHSEGAQKKRVVVAASTFDGWDTNLPWRIPTRSLCIKLMMAIAGIFFYLKNYIKKFSDHLKFKFPRLCRSIINSNFFRKFMPMKICSLVAFLGVREKTKKNKPKIFA